MNIFCRRNTTPSHKISLSSMAVLKSTNYTDVHSNRANYSPQAKEPDYENGLMNSKADMDSDIYKALVECIRHHQQLLL